MARGPTVWPLKTPLTALITIIGIVVIAIVFGRDYFKDVETHPLKRVSPGTAEPASTEKPPPPGETYDTGHWHGDVWHAEPHTPQDASETIIETQGARDTAQPVKAQIAQPVNAQVVEQANAQLLEQAAQLNIPMQEFPARTQEYYDAFEKWVAWENKFFELADEFSQVLDEESALIPSTLEELERYQTDEKYQREMVRKANVVTDKLDDVMTRQREHEEKRPPIPYTQ